MGTTIGVITGNTRSLDYGSYGVVEGFCTRDVGVT